MPLSYAAGLLRTYISGAAFADDELSQLPSDPLPSRRRVEVWRLVTRFDQFEQLSSSREAVINGES